MAARARVNRAVERIMRRARGAWGRLPVVQRALVIVFAVLVGAALADGLDNGTSLADRPTDERQAVADFCRRAATGSTPRAVAAGSIRHSPPEQTFVKVLGAGQYRVSHWIEIRTRSGFERAHFTCLAAEVPPGSSSLVLADLIAR